MNQETTNLSAGTGDVVPLPDQHRRIALVAVAEGAEIVQWSSELDVFCKDIGNLSSVRPEILWSS